MSVRLPSRRRLAHSLIAASAAVVLAAVAGCSSSGGSASKGGGSGLQTLRLANTKYAAELLPVTAGQKRGIFKAHGIDLQITTAKSSDIATSALVSNRADLALLQQAYVVSAAASGAPLVMVGNVLGQLDYHLIVSKEIHSVADLSGRKFGGPGPNNGNTAVMRFIMDKAGVGQKKLQYVTVGVQAGILASIRAGQVQAGLLVAPFDIQARQAGLRDLGSVDKYLPGASAAVIAGTSTTLKNKPALVRKFLAALVEATNWVADNPGPAVALLAKTSQMSTKDAQASYDEVKDIYAKDGTMSVSALKEWIAVSVKYGVTTKAVATSDIYDASYLPTTGSGS